MMQQQVANNEQPCSNGILIVEDDRAIGELLTLALAYETPYQPILVSSGQEALRAVQAFHPILFLLDYRLPDMTGLEVYDQLHAQKALVAVPAIMMSATLPYQELSRRHIADIEKPFELDDLLQTIERVLVSSAR